MKYQLSALDGDRVPAWEINFTLNLEIVTKDPQVKGFSVVKRRWVVERTLGWLMHHRQLVRDYEADPTTPPA